MSELRAGSPAVAGTGWLLGAWLGGAAFVASLALFLYVYIVPFGSGRSDAVVVPGLLNTALFTIFALHHSLFARTRAKQFVARVVPAWFERSLYTWTASV